MCSCHAKDLVHKNRSGSTDAAHGRIADVFRLDWPSAVQIVDLSYGPGHELGNRLAGVHPECLFRALGTGHIFRRANGCHASWIRSGVRRLDFQTVSG